MGTAPFFIRNALKRGDRDAVRRMARKGGLAAAAKRRKAREREQEVAEVDNARFTEQLRELTRCLHPGEHLPEYISGDLPPSQVIEFTELAIGNNEHICPID